MNHESLSTTDALKSEFRKLFLRSLLMSMSNRKLEKVAMYYFGNSRNALVDIAVEQIAGDEHRLRDFLRYFPLSSLDRLAVNQTMVAACLASDHIPHPKLPTYVPEPTLGH